MAVPTVGTVTSTYKAAAYPWSSSFSHSGTGADALLVCVTTPMSAAWDFTVATYAGVSLTKLFRNTNAQGTTWFYGLNGPASGSNTLTLSNSSQFGDFAVVSAVNLAGTNSTTPFGQNTSGGGSTTLTLAITTTTADSLLVACVSPYYHPTPTFSGSTQTNLWAETTNANMEQRGRGVSAATAAAYSVVATVSFNNVFGGMVEVLPSGGGGGSKGNPTRRHNRVRYWSIK